MPTTPKSASTTSSVTAATGGTAGPATKAAPASGVAAVTNATAHKPALSVAQAPSTDAGSAGDGQTVDASAWARLGLHPRLLAVVQKTAASVATAASGAGAGPTNDAEESRKVAAESNAKGDGMPLKELAQCVSATPSALLARVLTRTTQDFADALIDGRCACGVDSNHHANVKKNNSGAASTTMAATSTATYSATTGTTAAIWMDRNAVVQTAASASAATTTTDTTANDAAVSATHADASESIWTREPTGVGRALFNRASAVSERRFLVFLYAMHTLLTAAPKCKVSSAQATTANAQESSEPASSASLVHEACGVLIAATPESARLFAHVFGAMARACGVELVVVEEGADPLEHRPSLAASMTSPLSACLYVTTMPAMLQWNYPAFMCGVASSQAASTEVKDSTAATLARQCQPDATQRFLVVLAVEDLAFAFSRTDALLKDAGSSLAKCVAAHSSAAGAAASGGRGRTSATGRWSEAEKAWDAMLAVAQVYADHRASVMVSGGGGGASSSSVGAAMPGAQLRLPFFFWVTLGPLSCLSPLVRSRLSRRNRRYYPLSTSTYLSAAESAMTATGPGTTAPLSSTRMIYLFSADDKDKESQLQMILKQTHIFKRILLLTHHKEVRQLYGLIQRWGIFSTSATVHGDDGTTAATPAAGPTASAASTGTTTGPAGRQYFILRTDLPERAANLLLEFCAPTPSSSANGKEGGGRKPDGAALLVGWDSFTSVDLMDVDCVIQYFPPQKSLTEREWTEFIQNLHTTGDAEADVEFSLYSNPNNTEKNIRMKINQLHEELGPCGPSDAHYCSAARRHTPLPAMSERASETEVLTTASGTLRCGIRPPTVITMMGPPDLSLTAFFTQQYYYSGARGFLSPAAANASLAAAVQTGGGSTGIAEAVVASHSASHVPVLNVSALHPWFVPLVCGGSPAPAASVGSDGTSSSAKTRPHGAGGASALGTDGKPLTLNTVLKKKIALERCEQLRSGRDVAGSQVPHMIPCVFPHRQTPRTDERGSAETTGSSFPTAPATVASSSSSSTATANKPAVSLGAMPMPRSAAAAAAASGGGGGTNNNNNSSGGGGAQPKNNTGNAKGGAAKTRASPASGATPSGQNGDGGKKKSQVKDGTGGGDAGKSKQEETRTPPHGDNNSNANSGGGNKGNNKKSRSRKRGGGGGEGDGNAGSGSS